MSWSRRGFFSAQRPGTHVVSLELKQQVPFPSRRVDVTPGPTSCSLTRRKPIAIYTVVGYTAADWPRDAAAQWRVATAAGVTDVLGLQLG